VSGQGLFRTWEEVDLSLNLSLMGDLQKRVEEALDSIRPYLEADGGNVEVLEIINDSTLRIQLTGACRSCQMSKMTMQSGIEETIRRAVPEIREIVSVN
jgi:Fe-S cluster biogenesis protein NfuA